jgi:hypothetical protein
LVFLRGLQCVFYALVTTVLNTTLVKFRVQTDVLPVPTTLFSIFGLKEFSSEKLRWYTLSLTRSLETKLVGIATGYRLDDRGLVVRVSVKSRIVSSPRRPDRFWGPLSLLPNGCRVKRSVRETHHSPPTSAEVKKTRIYTSTPLYIIMS